MQTQPKSMPPQHQPEQPGKEFAMTPKPDVMPRFKGANKLKGKVAVITGGDSGIGRATAIAFAREGADVAIVYLNEHKDAEETKQLVEKEGTRCLLIPTDVSEEKNCQDAIQKVIDQFGKLDIVVNNAAEQHPKQSLEEITAEQLDKTFRTNVFAMFYITKAALKHLKEGSTIINTTSVTAYRGSDHLLDYSSTKGAQVAFTRSLSEALAEKKIRVNAVAPGPIWTPLIPSTFTEEKVEKFGQDVPLKRPGQPNEVAPCFVFLACDESSYITGQVLHPNGGEQIGS
jgi:NAD(P)-dependent dehydrogenase (short-subunit alcohol dehydrogenase family)